MRKIVYSVARSLDGYLAGPNGEADWIVMGRRTFEAAQAMGAVCRCRGSTRSWFRGLPSRRTIRN